MANQKLEHWQEGNIQYVAADGYIVGIDLNLTDDLLHEGLAQEVIHAINYLRRKIGLSLHNISYAYFTANENITSALVNLREVICLKTRSQSLISIPDHEHRIDAISEIKVFDGSFLRVSVSKVPERE